MLAWPLVAATNALRTTWLVFSGDGPGSMRKISDVSILLLVLPSEFQRWSHIPFSVNNQVVCALELQHNESAYDRPLASLFLCPKTSPRIRGIK